MYNYITELIGTCILLFVILKYPNDIFAIGITLSVILYIGSKISGGHFNPVVTIVKFINKSIDLWKCIGYIIVQILGGLLAIHLSKKF